MSDNSRPHFGTDGIRGHAESELTDEFVFALGQAISTAIFDELIQNQSDANVEILIGRDTRESGERILKALSNGLMSAGASVKDLGILPTPAISLVASKLDAYACSITASHNPGSDNGIKVFFRGGTKTNENFESKIEKYIDTYLEPEFKAEIIILDEVEDISTQAFDTYIEWLLNSFEGLDLSTLTIAVDCANGASYKTAKNIFEKFGANVLAINVESDGKHINENCGATDLSSLKNFLKNNKADIAFAFDGDADRIVLLDENANEYDGDYILALLASELNLDPKIVVATSMTNGALKTFLSTIEFSFVETEVGDKNVAEGMENSGAKIGGEQSGHIIVTDYAPFGDGVLVALIISKILESGGKKASDLLNLFAPMAQLHEKVSVGNKAAAKASPKIKEAIRTHLELLGKDARIVIRPSGTENIVRIMVEAKQMQSAQDSISQLADIVIEACKE